MLHVRYKSAGIRLYGSASSAHSNKTCKDQKTEGDNILWPETPAVGSKNAIVHYMTLERKSATRDVSLRGSILMYVHTLCGILLLSYNGTLYSAYVQLQGHCQRRQIIYTPSAIHHDMTTDQPLAVNTNVHPHNHSCQYSCTSTPSAQPDITTLSAT